VNDIKASLAMGIALILLGAALIRWHRTVWGQHRSQNDADDQGSLDDRELRHYRLQFRRRIQVSVLLILLGVMIPVGDWLMVQRQNPMGITIFWLVVLILALWIMLLAAIDWLSTRMFVRATRATLAGLARKQRELEAEADRLRGRGSNGRH
jgi:drug/metabolite transporter (DMT)-like permease